LALHMAKTTAIPIMVRGKNLKPRLNFSDLFYHFPDLFYKSEHV